MKIKIERTKKELKQKQEKPAKNKVRKLRVVKVGTHKKSVATLWLLLILSLSFGMYKNFTAIDQHTTHEKTVVKETLVDTSGIQSYVLHFAKVYFTWQNKKDALEARTENLKDYLTEDLQQLNADLVRADVPTSSVVEDVQIVKVVKKDVHSYHVTFSLQQKIIEGKKASSIPSTYEVTVHQDDNGNKIVTQNPTMTANTSKSNYQAKQAENDSSIDSATSQDVTNFIETFFKLYPQATKEELTYYAKTDDFNVLNKNLIFSKIHSLVLKSSKDEDVIVAVSIEYLDQDTKTTQIFQYQLMLEKQKNWTIKSKS